MVDTIAIGRAMQAAREKAGMSKQQLADASGISVKSISLYERGGGLPILYNAIAIAAALGVSLDTLIGWEVHP